MPRLTGACEGGGVRGRGGVLVGSCMRQVPSSKSEMCRRLERDLGRGQMWQIVCGVEARFLRGGGVRQGDKDKHEESCTFCDLYAVARPASWPARCGCIVAQPVAPRTRVRLTYCTRFVSALVAATSRCRTFTIYHLPLYTSHYPHHRPTRPHASGSPCCRHLSYVCSPCSWHPVPSPLNRIIASWEVNRGSLAGPLTILLCRRDIMAWQR